MEIHYHNRSKLSLGPGKWCNLSQRFKKPYLKQSEFLSINCPATPETTKLNKQRNI